MHIYPKPNLIDQKARLGLDHISYTSGFYISTIGKSEPSQNWTENRIINLTSILRASPKDTLYLQIWSFLLSKRKLQNFKFEVSYFYLHFGPYNHTSPLWFINIFSFIVLILKKLISHKYFKIFLQILNFTHKIK